MPIRDDQPCPEPLKTCHDVQRYPDVISFWIQSRGEVNRFVRDAPRYDFLAWVRPFVKDREPERDN